MIALQGCKQVGRFIFFKVKEIVPIYFTQFSARSNKLQTTEYRFDIPAWYTNKITIIDFTIYSRLLCTKNKNSEFTV